MATGAAAIKAVAGVTGISSVTVARAARALREAGKDLWPQAAPGGGKNAKHVQPEHLVNLVIALAVADPLTEAPQQVAAFTTMVATDTSLSSTGQLTSAISRWKRAVGSSEARIIPGETLGAALSGFIDWLSRPEGAEVRVIFTSLQLILRREDGYDPMASLSYYERVPGESGWSNRGEYVPDGLPINSNTHLTMLRTPGTIQRTSMLRLELFETLADLWADTQGHISDQVDTKSAALAGAALPIQDQNSTPVTHIPESTRERVSPQALSSRGLGSSRKLHRRTDCARHHTASASRP